MILKAEKDEEKPRTLMPKCLMNQSQPARNLYRESWRKTDNVEEDDPGERRESIEEEDTIKDLD